MLVAGFSVVRKLGGQLQVQVHRFLMTGPEEGQGAAEAER
jgi:hypothetical protein